MSDQPETETESVCNFTWLGPTVRWDPDPNNTCPDGQACSFPTYDGNYVGEPAATSCTAAKKEARGK